MEFVGNPAITVKGDEYQYTCQWSYQVNLDRYYAFVDRLVPVLDKLAISKGEFMINEAAVEEAPAAEDWEAPEPEPDPVESVVLSRRSIPSERNSESLTSGDFTFAVCTNTGSNFRNLRWKSYRFPAKYAVLFDLYFNVVPCLDISLLDGSEKLVTSKFEIANYKKYSCLFNLFPRLVSDNERRVRGPSSVSLINHDSYDFYGLFSIGPFWSSVDYSDITVYPKLQCTTTFTLTQADVSKIKSASITVVSNNPEMDAAYEKLPESIRTITTK